MRMPHTNNYNFRQEKGFSLVEILITMVISTLLIGFALGIYLFGYRYFLKWRNRFSLQNELHTLAQGITDDVIRSERIKDLKPHAIILVRAEAEKKYHIQGGRLLQNDKVLTNSGVNVVQFEFSQASVTKVESQKTISDVGEATLVSFSLVLASNQDTLGTTRAIYLRKPSNWKLLTKE